MGNLREPRMRWSADEDEDSAAFNDMDIKMIQMENVAIYWSCEDFRFC